jgi:hypothetical protein
MLVCTYVAYIYRITECKEYSEQKTANKLKVFGCSQNELGEE